MVFSLCKACSDGDLQKVLELLNDSAVDVELKGQDLLTSSNLSNKSLSYTIPLDPMGVTPLIEAVKNNHIDIVKLLLDRGSSFSLYFLNITQVQ